MDELLSPINSKSLVDEFISRFEKLILSGKISIGQKLPSERELAHKLGVSRPVVHEGIIALQAKGLVTLKPRIGAYVNDYRKVGSIEILDSILSYGSGELESHLFESLLSMRTLFEIETARLAARNRSDDHLVQFRQVLAEESSTPFDATDKIVELDFSFHHLIAFASANMIYPLIVNSFKPIYTNLTRQFFRDASLVPGVFEDHRMLVDSIERRDEKGSVEIMERMLENGAYFLRNALQTESEKGSKKAG